MEHFVGTFCGKWVSCVLGRLPKVLCNLFWVTGNHFWVTGNHFWVTGNSYLIGPWLTLHDGGRQYNKT